MGKDITTVGGLTIGLDLGDKHTVGCVLSASGEVEDGYYIFPPPDTGLCQASQPQ